MRNVIGASYITTVNKKVFSIPVLKIEKRWKIWEIGGKLVRAFVSGVKDQRFKPCIVASFPFLHGFPTIKHVKCKGVLMRFSTKLTNDASPLSHKYYC